MTFAQFFDSVDTNGDGNLDITELQKAFGNWKSRDLAEAMRLFDDNQDDVISREEFMDVMCEADVDTEAS